jgi:hypothetical protein
LYTYTSDSCVAATPPDGTCGTGSDFYDDTYQEINLGIGFGIFALDVAIGEWDGAPIGRSLDYNFTSVTIAPEKGPYYKVGIWGGDFEDQWLFPNVKTSPALGDGEYFELGYATPLGDLGVDLSVTFTYSSDLVVGDWDDDETSGDYALVFGLKKTFAIGGGE